MAADLAREIIDQTRPHDRPSRVCIEVRGRMYGADNVELLCITAPIINGASLVQVDFLFVNPHETLHYDIDANLEGAARCIEGVVRRLGSQTTASMHTLESDGGRSNALTSWTFGVALDAEMEKALLEKVKSILKSLMVFYVNREG